MKSIHTVVQPSPPSIPRTFHLPKVDLCTQKQSSPFSLPTQYCNHRFPFCLYESEDTICSLCFTSCIIYHFIIVIFNGKKWVVLWILGIYFFKNSLNINRNDSPEFLFLLGSYRWRNREGQRGLQMNTEVSFRAPNPTHSSCSYKETLKCHNPVPSLGVQPWLGKAASWCVSHISTWATRGSPP